MHWLSGIVIGIVVIALLVITMLNFRRYSWVILASFLVLLAIVVSLYVYDTRDKVGRASLDPGDIVLSDATLQPSHGSYYRFSAQVSNRSQRHLAAIDVVIELLDCEDGDQTTACTLSESAEKRIKVRLDKGGGKQVSAYVPFSALAVIRAENEWRYRVVRGIGR